MATGFIGISTIEITNYGDASGAVLSYTAPGGIRYAVLSIAASVSVSTGTTGTARAGILKLANSGTTAQTNSLNYNVILAPGQNWSSSTYVSCQNMYAYAGLTASVLEVI